LLLADVYENFRKMCKNYYDLDCCYYISTPELARNALLKMTDIELDLNWDIDQHLFIEEGLRGGKSIIAHRKGEVNDKYLKQYDESKQSKYIMSLDANNLYGWAMSPSLPYSGLELVDDIKDFDIKNVKDDSDVGHILEVNIEYPEELHDLQND